MMVGGLAGVEARLFAGFAPAGSVTGVIVGEDAISVGVEAAQALFEVTDVLGIAV